MRLGNMVLVVAIGGMSFPVVADVHWDICPLLENGQIVTHGVTHALTVNPFTGQDTSPLAFNYFTAYRRVFGYELGEDPAFPTFAADPGLNNEPGAYIGPDGSVVLEGTRLPLGSTLFLTVVDGLRFWTGSELAAPPAGEYLILSYGPHQRAITASSGPLSPLPLKTFTVSHHIHLHLNAVLCDAQGSTNPSPGIYVVQAILESSVGEIQASLPFWLVYNFGCGEEVHEAAVEWIHLHLLPEPLSLAVWLIGAAVMLSRQHG